MTIQEWGNIDDTAVGKQFIEKAEPVPWEVQQQTAVVVHDDFNKLLFLQRILVPLI